MSLSSKISTFREGDPNPLGEWYRDAIAIEQENSALRDEATRLFEALHRYGEHDEDCKAVDHAKLAILDHLCNCGLRQILREEKP